jgi:MraZ protein
MFLSTHESGVDAKKRVSVPASFRKALAGQESGGEEAVFVWPAIDKPCLEGGGYELVRQFQRAIERLKPLDPRREALSHAILGRVRPCRFDDGGRIVLDGELFAHAGIGEKVRFVGLGDRFQIWDPEAHQRRFEELQRLALDSADLLDPFEQRREEVGFR